MDDDNGKGASKNEQFGEGWERDPNRINPHLQVKNCCVHHRNLTNQVMWDDLIGEPEGVRSPDCTWNCSKTCFQVKTIIKWKQKQKQTTLYIGSSCVKQIKECAQLLSPDQQYAKSTFSSLSYIYLLC